MKNICEIEQTIYASNSNVQFCVIVCELAAYTKIEDLWNENVWLGWKLWCLVGVKCCLWLSANIACEENFHADDRPWKTTKAFRTHHHLWPRKIPVVYPSRAFITYMEYIYYEGIYGKTNLHLWTRKLLLYTLTAAKMSKSGKTGAKVFADRNFRTPWTQYDFR